jgi:tetratricopeptide (TPR) repeat protein
MRKGPAAAAAVVVVLFAAATLLKVNDRHDDHGTAIAADSALGQQRVREFWASFRAATSARVAEQTTAARDAYRNALELNPEHEDALYYLGSMELELGNYREAEVAWRRLVAINPGSARAHSRLGDLYACPDSRAPWNLATAEAEYARAAELNREETGPLLRLGEVAVLRGDLATAVMQFDAVIVTHPRSVEAHYLKGYVAWKRGQQAAAAAELRTAVALASAPQLVQQAPSEGDTKQGTTPLVVHRGRCRMFGDQLEHYAQLDRRLKQVASLHQRPACGRVPLGPRQIPIQRIGETVVDVEERADVNRVLDGFI